MDYPEPDWSGEFQLVPHPDFPAPLGVSVSVIVDRQGGALRFIYVLSGDSNDDLIRMPPPGNGGRTDELWKHTCFEAFVRVRDQAGYSELNFSPWGEWAAYTFDDYRAGMRDLAGPTEPFSTSGYRGNFDDGNNGYGRSYETVDAFDPAADWLVNLTSVLEATDGTKSYWALAHAPGPPDFHNPDCFIATLPAPERS